MPIRKQDYPPDWKEVSLRIREEAGQRCEWCGVPNGQYIVRKKARMFRWVSSGDAGKMVPINDYTEVQEGARGATKIILTVAHLDRDTTNNDRSNLAALCQRCHLNHDRAAQHIPSRKYGKNHAKEPQQKLFR